MKNKKPATVPEALRSARNIIRNKTAWTKGEYAITDEGHDISPTHHHAASWCAIGAIMAATPKNSALKTAAIKLLGKSCLKIMSSDQITKAADKFGLKNSSDSESFFENYTTYFNDHKKTKHDDIMKAYANAIRRADRAQKKASAG